MTPYLDLFTPETWNAFQASGGGVSGFRIKQRRTAERVRIGDLLYCYIVAVSRWSGLLRVTSELFIDETPIFEDPDPFVVRFKVEPEVMLPIEHAIPTTDPEIWTRLSLTKRFETPFQGWAQSANLRASLRELPEEDAKLLDGVLRGLAEQPATFPLTAYDHQKIRSRASVRALGRSVVVEVSAPDPAPDPGSEEQQSPRDAVSSEQTEARVSISIQARLVELGLRMGFGTWVPRADKSAIQSCLPADYADRLLTNLPINFEEATLRTIENIDVIWMKGRSIARAFEVEHTTAIYSGLLRMADLLTLQPNMSIPLHIVAPDERRDKVLREIRRPVFSLLERGPLYESCSYLAYSAIDEIIELPHLNHLSDSILEEYEELAQDT